MDIDGRIKLVDKITQEHKSSFAISGNKEQDKLVSIRVDILGTYILQADKEKGNTIMTRYKIKARKNSEIPFTEYSGMDSIGLDDKIL